MDVDETDVGINLNLNWFFLSKKIDRRISLSLCETSPQRDNCPDNRFCPLAQIATQYHVRWGQIFLHDGDFQHQADKENQSIIGQIMAN